MKKLTLSLAFAACLTSMGSFAADASAQLQGKLAKILPFSASFSQKVTDDAGQLLQENQGRTTIASGGMFRWETLAPDENLVVSNGDDVWLYNPFVEQVTILKLNQALANTPALLLSTRDPAAWKQYQIEATADGYLIRPQEQESLVEWLKLHFKGNKLVALDIKDVQGQLSQVAFTEKAGSTASSQFSFKVPSGADVEDLRE